MKAIFLFAVLAGCMGITSTLYAQTGVRTDDIAATAIFRDSIPALGTFVIDAPTDSIDRNTNDLARYAILNAELKAAAYRGAHGYVRLRSYGAPATFTTTSS